MNHRDILAALIACSIAAAALYLSRDYAPDARTFPQIIAGIMFACGLVILARTLLGKAPEDEEGEAVEPRVLIVMALTVAYIFGVSYVGYILASLIFIPLVSGWLGYRRWLVVGPAALLISFGVSYMFAHLFLTPLPTGAVWAWL